MSSTTQVLKKLGHEFYDECGHHRTLFKVVGDGFSFGLNSASGHPDENVTATVYPAHASIRFEGQGFRVEHVQVTTEMEVVVRERITVIRRIQKGVSDSVLDPISSDVDHELPFYLEQVVKRLKQLR